MADENEYKFGEVPRDGTQTDPGLKTYNIYELAEAQADKIQNRQAEERAEAEARLKRRLAAVEQDELPFPEADDAGR